MVDLVLLGVVILVPSLVALHAIDQLAGWFPTHRSNDPLLAAVGLSWDQSGYAWAHGSELERPGHGRTDTSGAAGRGVAGRRGTDGRGSVETNAAPAFGDLAVTGGKPSV